MTDLGAWGQTELRIKAMPVAMIENTNRRMRNVAARKTMTDQSSPFSLSRKDDAR